MARLRHGLRSLAHAASGWSRRRKLELLLDWIEPDATVLLVGVSAGSDDPTENQVETGLAARRQVVGLAYDPVDPERRPLAGTLARGDARRLPFADGSFDYVVSNAVIEHLGGRDGAVAALAESRRVARRGAFHATPNRRFPIESHTQVPILHWAPRRWQEELFGKVGRTFPTSSYWIFTRRELRAIAGDDTRVLRVNPLVSLTLITSWRRS
jgi:hypothetical protein